MRQSRAFFQVIEELLFYGFHAVMRSPVYALCNTHRLLDTGADLLVDRNVFLRFQSHSEAVGNDSIKVCGRVLFAGDANAQGLTILEGLDLLRAFQHFMLHGATLHLLVVTVLTIQPKDLTGPISPSGL